MPSGRPVKSVPAWGPYPAILKITLVAGSGTVIYTVCIPTMLTSTCPEAFAQDKPRRKPYAADLLLIVSCLAYLVLPIDLLPDFFQGIGRTDDIAVLVWTVISLRRRFLRGAVPRRTGLLVCALVTLLVTNYWAMKVSPPAWFYDYCYHIGAPWDRGGLDPDITDLIKSQAGSRVHASARAVDLGCGTGGYTIFLAKLGFSSIGVDFSEVALRQAGKAAAALGISGRAKFVLGDLTAPDLPGIAGTFDLLLDVSTLDDLAPAGRRAMAAKAAALARPGAIFIACAHVSDPPFGMGWLDFLHLSGVTQLLPGEIERLYGDSFEIVPPHYLEPDHNNTCYILTRK